VSRHADGAAPANFRGRIEATVPSGPDDPGHSYHVLDDGTGVAESTPKRLKQSKTNAVMAQAGLSSGALKAKKKKSPKEALQESGEMSAEELQKMEGALKKNPRSEEQLDAVTGKKTPVAKADKVDTVKGTTSLTFDGWSAPFRPGQYCTLARTIDHEQIQRHYSIASAPGEPLELFLTCVENGALSPCLFDLMPEVPIQAWSQPRGRFTLERVPASRDLWLVGTGTGLAPFLSMVRAGAPWPAFERVILIHTVRHVVDLGYRDEIETIAAAQPGRLVYLPTTRPMAARGVACRRAWNSASFMSGWETTQPPLLWSARLKMPPRDAASSRRRLDTSELSCTGRPARKHPTVGPKSAPWPWASGCKLRRSLAMWLRDSREENKATKRSSQPWFIANSAVTS